jgi:CheY-like chemotaxis protein
MKSPVVLIIDDEPATRSLIRDVLERAACLVAEASNGREGLEIYERINPEVIIVDLIMDGMDGFEMIRELRKRNTRARIVAMSGGVRSSKLDILRMAVSLGAHASLAKPFRPEVLLEKIGWAAA